MPDDFTTPPIAPPTVRGALPEAPQETRWPLVLGVIALILGGIGLIQMLGQLVLLALPPSSPHAMLSLPGQRVWTWISMIVGIPLESVLIAFGIGCIRRRRWTVAMGMLWSVLQIPLAIVGSIVGNYMFKEHLQSIAADPNMMPPGMVGPPAEFFGRLTLVMGTCLSCVLPVFILIWLRRPSIKAEVAQWR